MIIKSLFLSTNIGASLLEDFTINFSSLSSILVTVLDILLVWAAIYYIIRIVRRNARTMQIFKGILFIIVLKFVTEIIGLTTLGYLTDNVLTWGFLAIIIIFQPEIRSLLEKLGQTQVFNNFTTLTVSEKEKMVNEISLAVDYLAKNKIGALITFERTQSMIDYVQTGIKINATVTADLIISLFMPVTPLHDGAIIIQGDKISCASAYFPPTNKELSSKYGARHRAALGISEVMDCLTIVVSEESGTVSFTQNGQMFSVALSEFKTLLMEEVGLFEDGQ